MFQSRNLQVFVEMTPFRCGRMADFGHLTVVLARVQANYQMLIESSDCKRSGRSTLNEIVVAACHFE